MTSRRIQRILRWSGRLNTLFAPWGFVDDEAFMTKAGTVGVVTKLTGIDYEGLDDDQRRQHVHRFEAALRTLDPSYRVYQYLLKRPAPGRDRTLFEIELYLVLVHEGSTERTSWRGWWSDAHTKTIMATDLERATRELHQLARTLDAYMEELKPARLGKAAAFRFLRRLVNGDADSGYRLKYDTHIDHFIADAGIVCQADHLMVGDTRVKVLSMKDAPAATFATMLDDLYVLPGELTACLEWRRIPVEQARRDLHSRQRHFFGKRISLVNYLSSDTKPEQMLVDESAGAIAAQLGHALTEMEVQSHFFGECSLTLVFRGAEADRVAASAGKVLAAHDGSFITETYNLLNAWASIVPGNGAFNLRRLALLETHAADLSFLFSVDQGSPVDLAGRPPLLVLRTQQGTPYRYHLHVNDVGHTVVLGETGAGKTTALNAIAEAAQQYEPRTVIFDIGHGYRALANRHGGSYLEFGLGSAVAMNPFALPPTAEHLDFLTKFCRVLIEGADGYRLTDEHERELYAAAAALRFLPRESQRLSGLVLPRPLQLRLEKWLQGGRYGHLFDHATDALTPRRFQVFEFEAIREYPDLLEPLLFYVLHRVTAGLSPDVLTLCVMDEAWRFVQNPTLRAYVQSALKTWRKKNAAMILASQAIEDFASADLLRTVVESCPTALLLANPKLDHDTYARLFQLNRIELDLLLNLRPRGQLLLKRRGLAKVLDLVVHPLPASTPAPDMKEAVYA